MRSINLQRLVFEWQRISGMPLGTIASKAVAKIIGFLLGLLLLPLTLILHVVGYRHVTVFTDRIGHLAVEPDCLLKEQALSLIRGRKWILLAPAGRVANEHLLSYWEPHFIVIRSGLKCFLIANMSRFGLMRHDVSQYARVHNVAQDSFRICSKWDGRAPLLSLKTEDCVWRESALNQLGLPEGAWFVCLHAREGGFSAIDESNHSHRNSDIENYLPAIRLITSRGGWVVRIGDRSMKPLPVMNNVIDYAHHPLKSPRLDIILCASCKFILGSTSGICLVSSLFGIPAAIANMMPAADLWYGPRDISIPKRIWSQDLRRYLSLEESLQYPNGCYRYASQYAANGLDPVENDPDDIAELAGEMMDRLCATEFALQEDMLTKALYKSLLDNRYPSFYSCAHLAASFYRKYALQAGIPTSESPAPL